MVNSVKTKKDIGKATDGPIPILVGMLSLLLAIHYSLFTIHYSLPLKVAKNG